MSQGVLTQCSTYTSTAGLRWPFSGKPFDPSALLHEEKLSMAKHRKATNRMPNDHPQSLKHLLFFLYNSSKFFTAEIELIKKKIPLNKLSKLSSVA